MIETLRALLPHVAVEQGQGFGSADHPAYPLGHLLEVARALRDRSELGFILLGRRDGR